MGAAVTIAILLAISVIIIRVASVAMRLTGLPDNVSRFQCVSALTGTGFTTNEAEMIVNYPIRRRIVITLMLLGNLGLVSVTSTFIVAFIETGHDGPAILGQATILLSAIALTLLIMTNGTLDRWMTRFIGVALSRTTDLEKRGYHRIFQLCDGYSIVEHTYHGENATALSEMDHHGLSLMAIRTAGSRRITAVQDDAQIQPDDTLILYGDDRAHEALAKWLNISA